MKLALAILLLTATLAGADPLSKDTNGTPTQGAAWNGLYTELLTVNSKTINLGTACGGRCTAISLYAPADFIIRQTATASKTGSVSDVGLGGQWNTIIYNKNTPFLSVSSATNGRVRKF